MMTGTIFSVIFCFAFRFGGRWAVALPAGQSSFGFDAQWRGARPVVPMPERLVVAFFVADSNPVHLAVAESGQDFRRIGRIFAARRVEDHGLLGAITMFCPSCRARQLRVPVSVAICIPQYLCHDAAEACSTCFALGDISVRRLHRLGGFPLVG